jgi:alkanesulfonate monooxygenase SsuD/methylene tetrahydromethanopterin reductase-like flavin-dependent oxidoreductase (luciferase family)
LTGATIRVGVFLPRGLERGGPAELRRELRRIEDAGLDHVGIADHVSFHTGWGQDALMEAGMLAMLTPLPIALGVYLLALRHPVLVARQVAQIEQHAPGRLELGVGVGGEDRHEVEICGIDPRTRGRRTDECIEVLRGLWKGEPFTYRGRFYELDEARILPAPRVPPPIVVGGRDERALRRAGRLGDGWLGIWSTPEKYAERLASVEAAAREAGRTGVAWRHGLQPWIGFGRDAASAAAAVGPAMEALYRVPFERFARYTPCGTPADVAAQLRRYVEAGCRSFNVAAHAANWEEAVEALGQVRRLLNGS